jgi:hypothetical protein
MTAFTGESVVVWEKGQTKLKLFWPGCFGGLARWRGEVKEAEGALKLKVAEREETIAVAIKENKD